MTLALLLRSTLETTAPPVLQGADSVGLTLLMGRLLNVPAGPPSSAPYGVSIGGVIQTAVRPGSRQVVRRLPNIQRGTR